ncbi:MAG: HNH endonuclease [Actinobacteria bacterium]|nr:HNH endonuclease [Actinomycetota bacterium]
MARTISDLVMEYFQNHPNKDLKHGPVVDWVEEQYLKLYSKKPRDTWRAIRMLHQEGRLIKVEKGVYRYDPNFIKEVNLFDFPPDVREEIFKRDNYRCVLCNRGIEDGVEICADHRKPKDKGGDNSVDNGLTLCMEHNLMKKNYSQTEAGKRYFINMYKQAVNYGDKTMIKFCQELFDVYDKNKINGHIKRPNGK